MNLSKGLISVIIPCYNNAPYIRQCVDSVLQQTYPDFEIIIVDDGSTDNPFSELDDISDSRLRLKLKMPHRGVSTARNVGIHHAIGEYIVFIDGDDWVERNHLELLVNGLKKADCAMIMMQADYPNHSVISQSDLDLIKNNPIIKKANFNLLFENYLLSSPCNKIYRSQIINRSNYLQFDSSISYAEDLLFNLEYFCMIDSVALFPECTYHYVKHSDSGTTRFHKNTAYTLSRISAMASHLFGTSPTRETLTILMKHYIWGFFNLHHKKSGLNTSQICAEIHQILSIPEYKTSKSALQSSGISKKFQWILKIGSPAIIHKCILLITK